MVVGPDKVRCIYEIENSGQTYKVSFPFTKTHVNVFPVSNADIRLELERMEIICDGKITFKGIRTVANKMFHELQKVEGTNDREKLENLKIIANYHITPSGLKTLSDKMSEDFAMLPGGELAINECDPKGGLLKVVK